MILDHLAHAARYFDLGAPMRIAFEFLGESSTHALEPSGLGSSNSLRIELCENCKVFALVQRYHTRSPEHSFWEAHRKYIDVQCVVEGEELMGHMPLQYARAVKPYDAERDFEEFAPSDARWVNHLRMASGMFAVFMPHDVHMPSLWVEETPAMVKKIVVKVAAD